MKYSEEKPTHRVISRWWFPNIFYFHPYLGKISNLTSIFFRWGGSTINQNKSFPSNHMGFLQRLVNAPLWVHGQFLLPCLFTRGQ